ncbi:MAG: tRNA epoxyqueuosine(34) reductase QueG [Candidatus Obscuribacterales bacterium]|nr:tRNA epoxyqueuosine(34) reductase QueG [Candidatus Obscuribacterales bacterium]
MTSAKEIIQETACELGFERAVIASLEPLEKERKSYEQWLAGGYAGSMEYLKRDPISRTSPKLLHPEALSAVVLLASYYTDKPEDPGAAYGKVARYAVGRDYHEVIPQKLGELKAALEKKLGRPLLGKYFTDNVQLYEQALAKRSGLGFSGKNSMLIGPKLMGSYHFIAEFFTDIELDPDEEYKGTCGQCTRCASACPTDAIKPGGLIDARLCISFLTIENKGAIPLELRSKLGDWIFGCDICQEVCPYNQRPPQTKWKEFYPEEGAGHYLNLFNLLKIKSNKEFENRFAHTPLSRPRRKGLLRNALVVLGNRCPENGIQQIRDFALHEPNEMLREHAAWALSQYKNKQAKEALAALYKQESDPDTKESINSYCLVL